MLTIAWIGHRDIRLKSMGRMLESTFERMLERESEVVFYTDGSGRFSRYAEAAVRRLKIRFPEKQLRLVLVHAGQKQKQSTAYDGHVCPEELRRLHRSQFQSARKRWLAEHADIIIAAVIRREGMDYRAVIYAEEKNKAVVNLLHHLMP